MASGARALWNGAISFGLVHVPVSMYSAIQHERVDFDLVDRRDMAHVGYRRYNKTTGAELDPKDIVRGVKLDTGKYVTFDDAELKALAPEAAKTIDIKAFVDLASIPPEYFDTPYILGAGKGSDKVYGLLREALVDARLAGIALVVMNAREHLAALLVRGPALVLHTLRWSTELRDFSGMTFPPTDRKKLKVDSRELTMAGQLVAQMKQDWAPTEFRDTFRQRVLDAIAKKGKRGGKAIADESPADAKPAALSDLSELLRLSLVPAKGKASAPAAPQASATKPAAKKSAVKKPAVKKPAEKKPALKKPALKKPAAKKSAA
ncbi:hypothetical protein BH09PSE6_BH09PSE6_23530 [soil metagenome]